MEYSQTNCQNDHNAPPISTLVSNNIFKLETLDDELCIDKYISSKSYLQDFHHLDHHFPLMASSFNPNVDIQSNGLDPFDPIFQIEPYTPTIDFYGFIKPCEENGNYNNCAAANFPSRNDLLMDIEKALNCHHHSNPLRDVVPDESSCVTADNNNIDSMKLSKFNKKQKITKNNKKNEKVSTKRSILGMNKSKSTKGQWTVEEDRLLIYLVEKNGVRKWSSIAQMLKGRIGKQCRERWHNHLRPDIKKDIWTEDEDRILIEAHAEVGNKWSEIAKQLPGRTENSIKNHWNATKRRQFSRRKCKTKWPGPSSLLHNYIKSLNLEKECNNNKNNKSRNGNNIFKNPEENMTFIPDDDHMAQYYRFDEDPGFNFHYDDEQSFDSYIECTSKGVRLDGDDELCFDVELMCRQ